MLTTVDLVMPLPELAVATARVAVVVAAVVGKGIASVGDALGEAESAKLRTVVNHDHWVREPLHL